MVGSTSDPPNGPAVAGSVFAAVIVYAVRLLPFHILILIPFRDVIEDVIQFAFLRRNHFGEGKREGVELSQQQKKEKSEANGYRNTINRSSSFSAAFRHSYITGRAREGRYH